MIKWAYLFSSTIRSRGARYYRDGNVIKVVKQGNRFTASVRGEQTYQVKITVQEDRIKRVSCTCPYAKGGSRFKPSVVREKNGKNVPGGPPCCG